MVSCGTVGIVSSCRNMHRTLLLKHKHRGGQARLPSVCGTIHTISTMPVRQIEAVPIFPSRRKDSLVVDARHSTAAPDATAATRPACAPEFLTFTTPLGFFCFVSAKRLPPQDFFLFLVLLLRLVASSLANHLRPVSRGRLSPSPGNQFDSR